MMPDFCQEHPDYHTRTEETESEIKFKFLDACKKPKDSQFMMPLAARADYEAAPLSVKNNPYELLRYLREKGHNCWIE